MNIDMGFGFGFAWGVATAITVLSCIWWIAKGCFSLGHIAVKHFEKKKYEKIAEDYCSNPFKGHGNAGLHARTCKVQGNVCKGGKD